jgi:hypothetical protein
MHQLQNTDCFTCGTPLRIGSRFCVQCGTKRHLPPSSDELACTAPAVGDSPPDNDKPSSCTHCGKVASARPAGQYCRACGHRLEPLPVASRFDNSLEAAESLAATRHGQRVRTPGDKPLGTFARSTGRTADVAALVLVLGVLAGAGYWFAGRTASVAEARHEQAVADDASAHANEVHGSLPEATPQPKPAPIATPEAPSAAPDAPTTTRPAQPAATSRAAPPAARSLGHAATARSKLAAEPAPRISGRHDGPFPSAADELPRTEPAAEPAQGKTSGQVEMTLRGARTIDQLYHQRAAAECGRGPLAFLCRENVRFGLCREHWSRNEVPGMAICRVLARQGPPPDQ